METNDNGGNKGTYNELQKGVVRERSQDKLVKKLLLLGSGNSGKSTFFKQLLHIHGEGFSDKHIFDAKKSIYDCVILQMKNVIQQSKTFKYELDSNINELAKFITELPPNTEVNEDVANAIDKLWNDKNIKNAFHNRTNLGIVDSADYFFTQIQRIAKQPYIPSKQVMFIFNLRICERFCNYKKRF